ncbi:VWA-like domain-containing protein [Clostridium sp.]|uniref:vWA domain-containing protein n=1 Tax=Clostridium sp. TaxID=1506 RepID=UPI0026051C96|nr:VWA-like domain-containing protein [Clostridium sp.]
MEFNDRRLILIDKLVDMETETEVNSDFEREFFSLVERVIVNMIQGEDNFFGQFLVRLERAIRFDITWPLATVPKHEGYKMYFNPRLFLECNESEMGALFKHEIYHIMYGHHEREKELRNKYTTTAVNMALDISVNQYINNMPTESFRLERFNMEFYYNLKPNEAIEIYAEKIEKAIEEKLNNKKEGDSDDLGSLIDISKAHDIWEESSLDSDSIKELTKKIAISSMKDNAPEDIKKIVSAYTQIPQISWQEELKRLIPTIRAGQKKTITRRDRRQPERIDIRGKLPNSIPEIIVAIDISASISEKEIQKIMVEVLDIAKNRTNKITIIESDNEIRRVYEIRSKNDIKKRTSDNGATKFSPVFKYLKDNRMRNHVLIYFTDGVGEKELEVKPISKNVIWVLTGDDELSLNTTFGRIKKIDIKVEKGEGGTTGLEMIKEYQQEHGRYY